MEGVAGEYRPGGDPESILIRPSRGGANATASERGMERIRESAGNGGMPLPLCTLGHDTTRWIGTMCLDASLLLLYLCQSEEPGGPVRAALSRWAAEPPAMAWLAYLIAIGPYGATGIRTAEQFIQAWTGY